MALYIYAITEDSHPLRLDDVRGVGDPPEPLSTISESALTAVVSAVPEGLRARRHDVMAHQNVVQQLMADGTVLPLRFGTLASDEPQVRKVLTDGADAYHERLRALSGCSEYLLKGSYEEEELLRRILSDSAEVRRLNEESRHSADPNTKIQLGELVAGEIRARTAAVAAEVVEALGPLAREVHENEAGGNDFVSVSFLVPDTWRDDFAAARSRLEAQERPEYQFRLHGPLPPYSFVQET